MLVRRRQTRTEKKLARKVRGWIDLDMFHISIPIFTSDEDRIAVLTYEGIECEPANRAVYGLAGWGDDEAGVRHFFVVLREESDSNTWVHEASHLVDFIIEHLGLDPGIAGTEARAYMLGHIYSSIEDTITKIQAELSIPMVVTAMPYNEIPA